MGKLNTPAAQARIPIPFAAFALKSFAVSPLSEARRQDDCQPLLWGPDIQKTRKVSRICWASIR